MPIHQKPRIRTHRNGEPSHESDEDSLTVVGYDSVCLDGDQGAHEDEEHDVDERLYVILELHFANPLDVSAVILLLEKTFVGIDENEFLHCRTSLTGRLERRQSAVT